MQGIEGKLLMIIGFLVFVILALAFIYWYMSYKNKNKPKDEKGESGQEVETSTKGQYSKASIFDFMEFDKIEDSMIIQDNGKKCLMVIACEGVNYDLMSEIEKNSVEIGFVQFLNTLKFPIQLYVQTRTVNIERNIVGYNERLSYIKNEINKKQREHNYMLKNSDEFTQKQIQNSKLEFARLQNLYDYGIDIVKNIEKTSKNQNVLKKSYYVVIPYYLEEVVGLTEGDEEKKDLIFPELYTRAQSVIRALFMSNVKARILNSVELADLLYVSYNRDESEVYGMDKILAAGYDSLYSIAPDVLDKKMKALDEQIKKEAFELAKDALDEARTIKEIRMQQKEKALPRLIKELAERMLKDNEKYIGSDLSDKAIDVINIDTREKEEKQNEEKTKKRVKTTTRK